jgi:hypothetical protein
LEKNYFQNREREDNRGTSGVGEIQREKRIKLENEKYVIQILSPKRERERERERSWIWLFFGVNQVARETCVKISPTTCWIPVKSQT